MSDWRVGTKLGRTLYLDDDCIGMVDTPEIAAKIVGRMNEDPPEYAPTIDRGPKLRPHSIPGWWQVWSGYMCIALLKPEDVAPVLEKGKTP